MKNKYKLSICMMVKNEEKNLRKCLENIKSIIKSGLAELIIVDTGSTDGTIDIAKEYTNKVYFHKWNKNFSEMRNISISYAKGEWIFILDADERLDDYDKLIKLMESSEIDNFNTILLQIRNLYNNKDESKYNLIVSPRIFRNDGNFRYEGAVHNQPIFNGPNLNVDINITHFGYISDDKELMERKFQRTSELLKSELLKNPNSLYYRYQLGVSYDMHGDYKESLGEFRKAYNIVKNKSVEEKKLYTYIYGSHCRIAYTNNEIKEAIEVGKEALKLEEDYVDLYYLLGISENHLGNKEEAFNYLNKYLKLIDKYNELEISKDMSIIMYHIDNDSISNANFQIYQYYFNKMDYKNAYKYYKNLTITNQKIYASTNILLEVKKYKELLEIYNSLDVEDDKNLFLINLEDRLNNIEKNERRNVYKIFSSNADIYGEFNKLRLNGNKNIKLAYELIEKIDYNNMPLFYYEIFLWFKSDISFIIQKFNNIELINLRKIIKELIEKNEGFKDIFEDYILDDSFNLNSLEINKIKISISTMLLGVYLKENKEINKKYMDIFYVYIESGVNFISLLYKIDNAKDIYKYVHNEEDRFFILIYLIKNYIENGDKKTAIKYMLEAVKLNKVFSKYIDIYKDKIFKLNENESEFRNNEFEEYKIKFKNNISQFINEGLIEESKILISEYETIVENDADIYSMKSIIHIIEGDLEKAQILLEKGLKLYPQNEELLFNLSYIENNNGNEKRAIELYSKAKLINPNSEVKLDEILNNTNKVKNDEFNVIGGTIEIANQMNTITRGLKNLGINAKSINYYPSYLNYKSDYSINLNSINDYNEAINKTKENAIKLISENDVFHFHFNSSLVLDNSDLPLLKELGKKVIMHHWGSDVRMYSKAIKLNPYIKVKTMDENYIKSKLEYLSTYISDCIVADFELYEYVKDFYKNIHFVNQAIDLENYKVRNFKNNKLTIVHAPSAPEIKGTNYIIKAIEELKEKYDFEFKLVQGMAHEEAKKIYEKADIIIDQILGGSYGLFSIEAMALGKPVICWITDYMREKYPKELPIISANPDNIKEKIEYLINNKEILNDLGRQGREYVEKYHDSNIIAKQILDIYKNI